MIKRIIKVLILVILVFSSTVSAQDISSEDLIGKTRVEIYNELCELFPDEIELAKKL